LARFIPRQIKIAASLAIIKMKSFISIIAIALLFATFLGIANAQVENREAAGEAQNEIANQPKPMIQLMIYWLAILIIAYVIAKLSAFILNQLANRRGKPDFISRWLLPISRAIIYGIAFYIVFSGIIRRAEFGGYIIIGAFAIALGFASKDLLSSWLGGFVILFNRPFRLGDRIKIDAYEGEVIAMGLFSVKMMTTDGQLVVVPNSRFLRRTVTRATNAGMNSPVEVEFILPGSFSLEQMEKIAREAALTSKYVYLPEPVLVTSADDFRGIFLTKLKVKASVFDFRYAAQFAEDIRKRVKAELRRQRFAE
ncbi:MAG: mechanosensitive ion channel family protein, partial [Candidatus Poribacteria bacterium]